jgi:hypothetical protein
MTRQRCYSPVVTGAGISATIVIPLPGASEMIEREMQELLWRYPERLLNEPLQQFAWETSSDVGRADLVFEDRMEDS